MTSEIVTQDFIKECVTYNPETGEMIWKERPLDHFKNVAGMKSFNSRFCGKSAGTLLLGYISLIFYGKQYFAHNLIWLYMTGRLTKNEVDHIDHDRTNNSWRNLRLVSKAENLRNKSKYKNNKSGCTGVAERDGKWIATIQSGGRRKNIGTFSSMEEAVAARKAEEINCHFHENHGA